MSGTTAKYWEGRTPPKGYYDTVDPYQPAIPCGFDLSAILQYAKETGKKLMELTYEEVNQFKI